MLLGAEILGRHVLLHHAPVPQRQQPAGAGPGEGRGLGAGAVLQGLDYGLLFCF